MKGSPLFIHIPRTGGTSVRRALGLEEHHEIHLTGAEHRRRLGAEEFDGRFVFTILRNPWDRAVSLFHFLYRNRDGWCTPEGFQEWVRGGMLQPDGKRPVLYAGTNYAIAVTAPQARWVKAVELDKALHTESLFFTAAAALSLGGRLPHLNRSYKYRTPRLFYDNDSLERVGEIYREDAQLTHTDGPSR